MSEPDLEEEVVMRLRANNYECSLTTKRDSRKLIRVMYGPGVDITIIPEVPPLQLHRNHAVVFGGVSMRHLLEEAKQEVADITEVAKVGWSHEGHEGSGLQS